MPSGRASPELLRKVFTRNAYVRVPNLALREHLGSRTYKKGYEVRFPVKTIEEVEALSELLLQVGLLPARPFKKAKQLIVPVYGKQAVEHFLRFHRRRGLDRGVRRPAR